MTIPALLRLREKFPEARITLLVEPLNRIDVPGFLIGPSGNSRARFVGHRPGTEIRWQANSHLWFRRILWPQRWRVLCVVLGLSRHGTRMRQR